MNPTNTVYGWWNPRRISFALVLLVLLLLPVLQMATAMLTILFASFVLRRLAFGGRKWLSIVLFTGIVCLIGYAFGEFARRAAHALPSVADESIPKIIAFAEQRGVDLPFDDAKEFRTMVGSEVQKRFAEVTNFAKLATKEVVILLLGLVIACSIFLKPTLDLDPAMHKVRNNLYSACCLELTERFKAFYHSFETVMGAQIIISLINTSLTSVFILATSMKHPLVLVGVTFLCGLLPIIGNIISNCVIVAVGFTMSPVMAIAALVFLIALHKLEYFLNSKIIGDRIRNPVWLTMLGLIIGERILGIPGMIFAPVVLYYLKLETGSIPAPPDANEAAPGPGPSLKSTGGVSVD
ncbi:MAG: AI-2E family transporter [Verrucomicrobia bacterium]|nr:AI-2E family transporter [Verrucomicrobiota bacterium]